MAEGGAGSYGTKTVTTSAQLLVTGRSIRDAVLVQNVHASNDLYIGTDSSVLSTTGIKIVAGASFMVPTRGDVYGIASASGTDVRYLEVY